MNIYTLQVFFFSKVYMEKDPFPPIYYKGRWKKSHFLMAGPLRGGGGGQAIKDDITKSILAMLAKA